MTGYLVIERPTGPPAATEPERTFGPFDAIVIAELWRDKRRKEVEEAAVLMRTDAVLRRHPRMYFIVPLFAPNW